MIWPPREATSSAAECPPVQRGRPVRGIPASESRDAVYWQDGRNAVETERRISGSCSPPYIPLLARGGRHAAPWISLYVAEGGEAHPLGRLLNPSKPHPHTHYTSTTHTPHRSRFHVATS